MPQGDRTGPSGQGPMTGRAMGFCAGFNSPGFMNNSFGRGMNRGFGRGMNRGFRRGFGFTNFVPQTKITKEQEKEILNQELKSLKQDTKEIEERLKELK